MFGKCLGHDSLSRKSHNFEDSPKQTFDQLIAMVASDGSSFSNGDDDKHFFCVVVVVYAFVVGNDPSKMAESPKANSNIEKIINIE